MMAAPDISVRQLGGRRFAVMVNGAEMRVYHDWHAAEAHAVRLRADAAKQKRKCLRCNTPFLSWGVGNRLCDHCRKGDNFDGAV